MSGLETKRLPRSPDYVAPDGSEVRLLLGVAGGGLAHFTLGPGKTSQAVAHRSVEEIWYVVGGVGEMWRRLGGQEAIVALEAGVCLTIPVGTHFQFRCTGAAPLTILGVTMPPWPGSQEAFAVDDHWPLVASP